MVAFDQRPELSEGRTPVGILEKAIQVKSTPESDAEMG